MNEVVNIESLFHRSRARIKDLGEVFTPKSYVEDMLALLNKDKRALWSDEETAFFEMSCGHGNIVLAIYKKRLEALSKKANASGIGEASLFAVANSINTLWAIDIDSKNISQCRTRVLVATLDFLKENLKTGHELSIIEKRPAYFAHLLCAIKWHISENEALSALSNSGSAEVSAQQTKAGAKWFARTGHRPVNFELSWATYFENCQKNKAPVIDFERSLRFVKSVLSGGSKLSNDFEFAKFLLELERPNKRSSSSKTKDFAIGV